MKTKINIEIIANPKEFRCLAQLVSGAAYKDVGHRFNTQPVSTTHGLC